MMNGLLGALLADQQRKKRRLTTPMMPSWGGGFRSGRTGFSGAGLLGGLVGSPLFGGIQAPGQGFVPAMPPLAPKGGIGR